MAELRKRVEELESLDPNGCGICRSGCLLDLTRVVIATAINIASTLASDYYESHCYWTVHTVHYHYFHQYYLD